ncbi:MFS transporter [Nocardioides sp. 31GB23]
MFDRVLGSFFWGKTLSSIGIWIHNVVAVTVAFQITNSTLVVGLVSIAQFGPQIVLAPLSGKWADRGNAPLQIILGRVVTALGSAGMATAIWLAGGVSGLDSAVSLIALSVVVGVGFALGGPAMQSVVPLMIRPGEMAAAMTLNSVPMTLSRAVGPALGVLIVARFDAVVAFAIAAATQVFYAVIVLVLRLPRRSVAVGADSSVRGAWRYVRKDSRLLVLLLGIAAVGFGVEPTMTLVPALADDLGGQSGLVGWLVSAFGVGSGIGFLLFTPLDRRLKIETVGAIGLLSIAAGLVGVAISPTPAGAFAGFMVAGLGMTLAFSGVTTQIQERTPEEFRGRIMALWFVAFLGARPFAAALTGYLADVVSVDAAFVITAAAVFVAAILVADRRAEPATATVPAVQVGSQPKGAGTAARSGDRSG